MDFDYTTSHAMYSLQRSSIASNFTCMNDDWVRPYWDNSFEPTGVCENYEGYHLTGECNDMPMYHMDEFVPMNQPWNDYDGGNNLTWDFSQPHFQVQQIEEKKSALEEMLMGYIDQSRKNKELLRQQVQNQQASIQNLERDVRRISQLLSERAPGTIPPDTQASPNHTLTRNQNVNASISQSVPKDKNPQFSDYSLMNAISSFEGDEIHFRTPDFCPVYTLGCEEDEEGLEVTSLYSSEIDRDDDFTPKAEDVELSLIFKDDELDIEEPLEESLPLVEFIYPQEISRWKTVDDDPFGQEPSKKEYLLLQAALEGESFIDSRVGLSFLGKPKKELSDILYTTRGVNDWLTLLIRGTFSTDFTCRPISVGKSDPTRKC